MSAATADAPVHAKPENAVVFLARRDDLRLVLLSAQPVRDAGGNEIGQTPTQVVRFEDGKLRVPRSGTMKGEKGEALDAKEVLARLIGDEENDVAPHGLLGDRFDGFWQHDEPAPAPTLEEREHLATMGMDLDIDGLAAFISAEEGGWSRPELIAEARLLLDRARAKQAEMDEKLAEARAAGAAEAAAATRPTGRSGRTAAVPGDLLTSDAPASDKPGKLAGDGAD